MGHRAPTAGFPQPGYSERQVSRSTPPRGRPETDAAVDVIRHLVDLSGCGRFADAPQMSVSRRSADGRLDAGRTL